MIYVCVFVADVGFVKLSIFLFGCKALIELIENRVPFRCVDEINQGMDVVNERRVWELLLRTAENYSAQYFYLAPKFPRQLKFDGTMRVLACMSGANRKRAKSNKTKDKGEDLTDTHIRRAERIVKKRAKDAAKAQTLEEGAGKVRIRKI